MTYLSLVDVTSNWLPIWVDVYVPDLKKDLYTVRKSTVLSLYLKVYKDITNEDPDPVGGGEGTGGQEKGQSGKIT